MMGLDLGPRSLGYRRPSDSSWFPLVFTENKTMNLARVALQKLHICILLLKLVMLIQVYLTLLQMKRFDVFRLRGFD